MRKFYYRECSDTGRAILRASGFPEMKLLYGECIDCIEYMNLDFCMGNAVKYIWRLKKKFLPLFPNQQMIADLTKAKWYVERYLSRNKNIELVPKWIVELNVNLATILRIGKVITLDESMGIKKA